MIRLTVIRGPAMIRMAIIVGLAALVAIAIVGPPMVRYAFGASTADVASMEAALGVAAGSTRVLPQCGCTIRYLGTKKVSANTFAVYIQKLN